MEIRWLKRKEDDVESRFYPITHINAIVMSDEDGKLETLIDSVNSIAKPTYKQSTLYASKWVGDAAPYTYIVTGYDGKTVEVLEDVTMSTDQLGAIEDAKIKSDPSSTENILYAFGDKPLIDLPVLLKVY